MKISVCIPTLNRYDLLRKELESLEAGTVKPDNYYVIDNGQRLYLDFPRTHVQRPPYNVGVAASWNWFIDNVGGIRLICNDDILFHEDTLEKLLANYSDDYMLCPDNMMNSTFSCYILPDKIINKVGKFDESISPNYGYFEDNDYYLRMTRLGFGIKSAENCNVSHFTSSTLKALKGIEAQEHHRKFELAQSNYVKKWGGLPGHETYQTPYNIG